MKNDKKKTIDAYLNENQTEEDSFLKFLAETIPFSPTIPLDPRKPTYLGGSENKKAFKHMI